MRRNGFALFHFFIHGPGGRIDAVCDGLHIGLDLPDQFLNLLGALFRCLRQCAHFVRDDRKAFAVLAGASGLNGRIQSQQVGLVGNARHGLDDVADGRGLLFQVNHQLHRSSLALRGHAHIGDQAGHVAAGPDDQRLNHFALAAAEFGTLQLLGDGDAHLLESGQGLLRRARRLFGACGDLIAGAFQFFGRARCLGDPGGQLPRRRRNAFGRLLLFSERPGLLALRFRLAARYQRGLSFRRS